MGTTSDVSSGHRRWSDTRLARALLFVGIVWSITGGFLFLLNVAPELAALVLRHGWVSPNMAVDPKLRMEAAQRCAEPTGGKFAIDEVTLQRARYPAYQLGKHFGTAALGRSSEIAKLEVAQIMQDVKRQASALGVPTPELPVIRHMATELGEFSDALEADLQCTATRLASRYTQAHGEIYRFGAVIGYATRACVQDRCAAFGVHIRRYGEAAGVPERLWLPMTWQSLAGVPGTDSRDKAFRVIRELEEHIRTGR
jgi:hypothetical protein